MFKQVKITQQFIASSITHVYIYLSNPQYWPQLLCTWLGAWDLIMNHSNVWTNVQLSYRSHNKPLHVGACIPWRNSCYLLPLYCSCSGSLPGTSRFITPIYASV